MARKIGEKNNNLLLYLFVYQRMIEKFGRVNRLVTTKQILEIWRRQIYNVPRRYDFFIIKEMEDLGFIEKFTTQKNCFYGADAESLLRRLRRCDKKYNDFNKLRDELLKVMLEQKWKFIGTNASKKLQKLNDFLW